MIEAAAKAGATLIKPLFLKLTLRLRVARAVVKRALLDEYRISLKELRSVLRRDDVAAAIHAPTDERRAIAFRDLQTVRLHRGEEVIYNGPYLYERCVEAYISSSNAEGTRIAYAHLSQMVQSATRSTPGGKEQFDRFHPVRSRRIRELYTSLGEPVKRAAEALIASTDRRELIAEWSKEYRSWLPQDPGFVTWLAEFAGDLNCDRRTIVGLYDRALSLGVAPPCYWKVRRLWANQTSGEPTGEELAQFADCADYPLWRAIQAGVEYEDRVKMLDTWHAASESEQLTKAVLRAELALQAARVNEAITFGRTGWTELSSTSAGLVAVKALMVRANSENSVLYPNDSTDALQLALQIRDSRRAWEVPSGEPASLAIQAALQSMDFERAWKISEIHPDGEATEEEARSAPVKRVRARLLAMHGRIADARELVQDLDEDQIALEIDAIEAEFLLDDERAGELYARAIAATDNMQDKAGMAFNVALRGIVDPFVEELQRDNPDIASEIRAVARLFSGDPDSEGVARHLSRTSPRMASALIAFYSREQRFDDLVAEAEAAAARWNDPHMWLRAARGLLDLNHPARAIETANKAILASASVWSERFETLILRLTAETRLDDWGAALRTAVELSNLKPDSRTANWAVVICLLHTDGPELAYQRWIESRYEADNEEQAVAWMHLYRVYGTNMGPVSSLLAVNERFAHSPTVRRLAIFAVVYGPVAMSDADLDVNALIEKFRSDFVGDETFIAIPVDTEAAPQAMIDAIAAAIGPRPDLSAQEKSLELGLVPVGVGAMTSGAGYAEFLISRSTRPKFAGSLGRDRDLELSDARSALHGNVVADTTSLLALADLDQTTSQKLAGQFLRVITTNGQLLDATAALEAFTHPSIRKLFDGEAGSTEGQNAKNLVCVRGLIAQFRSTERVASGGQANQVADLIGNLAGVWSDSLNQALTSNTPFWCDDAATRSLARHHGLATFGTPALIEVLRSQAPAADDYSQALIDLIVTYRVGFSVEGYIYEAALQRDQYEVAGAATALRFGAQEDINRRVHLALGAMQKVSWTNIEQLAIWSRTVATFLSDMQVSESRKAAALAQWTFLLLTQGWLGAEQLALALSEVKIVSEGLWPGVLRSSIKQFRSELDEIFDDTSDVATFILVRCANLPDDDRLAVVAVVLQI